MTSVAPSKARANLQRYNFRNPPWNVTPFHSLSPLTGKISVQAADAVVQEVKKLGGNAVANYDSVEHGESIINSAIQKFGRIDVLINNAGILRDVSFKNMSDKDWDLIFAVHVTGAYKVR